MKKSKSSKKMEAAENSDVDTGQTPPTPDETKIDEAEIVSDTAIEPESSDAEDPSKDDEAVVETAIETAEDDSAEADDLTDPAGDEKDPETVDDSLETEPESVEDILAEPAAPAPEQKVVVQKTGFLATTIAGVVAAGVGFLAAQFSTQSWPFEPGPSIDPLAVAQSAQDGVTALEGRLAATEEALANQQDAEPAAPDLSGVEAQLGEISSALGALEERISALEARPVAEGTAPEVDISGVETEIENLQSQLEDLIAEANVAEASAAAAAQGELARAALARIMANLETGAPFADALADIKANSDATVPDILEATAADGVPTLASLQEAFDPVARDALAAARAGQSGESAGVGDRLTSFLRARTGARSVEPREGDDPDAVLSRVGASIANGNISDALAETEALPEAARAEMSDWLSQAETRNMALAASEALSQELNSN